MSVEATRWVWQLRGVGRAKFVLSCLADMAGPDGVCFPSIKLIASQCEITTETVAVHLAALERNGFIQRLDRHRDNRSRTSNFFVLAPLAVDRGSMCSGSRDQWPAAVVELARSRAAAPLVPSEDPDPVDVVADGQLSLLAQPDDASTPESSGVPIEISGGPEPPLEPRTAVCETAPAPDRAPAVLSPSLTAVLEVLSEAPNAQVEDAHIDIVLRSFPDGDHVGAAQYVLLQLLQPDCRCRTASLLLHTYLRNERRAETDRQAGRGSTPPHGGRRRPAPPLPQVSPAGRRWGPTDNKYDRAAGLV